MELVAQHRYKKESLYIPETIGVSPTFWFFVFSLPAEPQRSRRAWFYQHPHGPISGGEAPGCFCVFGRSWETTQGLEGSEKAACGWGWTSLLVGQLRSHGCCCLRLVGSVEDGVFGPRLSRWQVKQGQSQADRSKICTDNNITCNTVR